MSEKESYRWVQTLGSSTLDLPEDMRVVTVCDRQGDMYELFDEAIQTCRSFLIRIAQNRKTVENTKILDEIKKKPCVGMIKASIPRDSRRGFKEREATLHIRYDSFEIQRPSILNKIKYLKTSHKMYVIHSPYAKAVTS